MTSLDIAVVGSGISGLGAAWLLGQRHRVTLYEKEPRFGGHSNTVTIRVPEGACPVDTGFIVYNPASYPNLVQFFAALGVQTAATNMSFAVSLDDGRYEYSGSGVGGLFGQPSNLVKPAHWRMVGGILRFFRDARALVLRAGPAELSLGAWLAAEGYSDDFVERHILPMGAAIWSTPSRDMLAFPALSFARFFANHGLLQVRGRPKWRTVEGGSKVYVAAAIAQSGAETCPAVPVRAIRRLEDAAIVLLANGAERRHDAVVVATHADNALALLADADSAERQVLGAFRYAANTAVLHTDARLMPARRRLWSSWNFIGTADGRLAVSYWMNRLQPLPTRQDVFVTLNPPFPPRETDRVAEFAYQHPMFDGAAMAAQPDLFSLQGRRRTWFAGSYFGYGFHEDGLQAGLWVAEQLGGVRRPWTGDGLSNRLQLPPDGWRRPEGRAA